MSKKLKKKIPNIIFGIVFLVGLAIFLYPSVSNYINSRNQSRAISTYQEALTGLSEEEYSKMWDEAYKFNDYLAERPMSFNLDYDEATRYSSILDATGTGIIGYIEIENIGVNLPIYHGTEESVLQVGIGHLEGTSFPTGTTSTHVVLSGHRGLPSSKLFSDLDQMIVGDTFLLHIMDQTFAYEVDQIKIVKPYETDDLSIVHGKDYCTLITCTPYGVNTQRLMVRGHRIPYTPELLADAKTPTFGTVSLRTNYLLWVIVGLAIVTAFIIVLHLIDKRKSK